MSRLPEHGGEHPGDLGLADARLAFQQQRPVERERHVHGRGQPAVGDVGAFAQQPDELGDPGAQGRGPVSWSATSSATVVATPLALALQQLPPRRALVVVDRTADVLQPPADLPGARPDLGPHVGAVVARGPDGAQDRDPFRLVIHAAIVLRDTPARQSPDKPSLRPDRFPTLRSRVGPSVSVATASVSAESEGDLDPAERVRPGGPAGHGQGRGVGARGERARGLAGHRCAASLPGRPAPHPQRERHGADPGRVAAADDRRPDGVAGGRGRVGGPLGAGGGGPAAAGGAQPARRVRGGPARRRVHRAVRAGRSRCRPGCRRPRR